MEIYYRQRSLNKSETAQTIFEKVRTKNYCVLLESSQVYTPKTSEFSIIALEPELFLSLTNNILDVLDIKQNKIIYSLTIENAKDVMNCLDAYNKKLCPQETIPEKLKDLPFIGGLTGYINYDFVRLIEKLPSHNKSENIPSIEFIGTRNCIIINHKEKTLSVISQDKDLLDKLLNDINKPLNNPQDKFKIKAIDELTYSFSEPEFINAVDKIKDYIAQGEIYQANISIQFKQTLQLDPYKFYKELYKINPSPFNTFLHFNDFYVVCNSPERLVKYSQDGCIETRPIAGTRGRGKTLIDDENLENILKSNIKERSEHIMLVDLERNDLGKVSKYGSVVVDELLVIEKYSHVMHLVSNVIGKLSSKFKPSDIIPALFPGGTITGVPKIRCMEIIEETEPVRRDLYTGSIGYIDFRGNLDFNIVIRTAVLNKTSKDTYKTSMQFGAGIVADSVGSNEYKECIKKGKAIFNILNNTHINSL